MNLVSKPFVRLTLPLIATAAVAIAWQGSSPGISRPAFRSAAAPAPRVEATPQPTAVQDSAGLAALTQQVAALQQSVDATNQAVGGQIAALKASVASLQAALTLVQQGVASAQSTNAGQAKKIADLSATLTGVNQLLTALQQQFQAELRKLSGAPTP